MFRIGVISDTHAHTLDDLSPKMLKALSGVELILHAGDFTQIAVLEGLKTLAQVRAVHGNMDSVELKALLPAKDTFIFAGRKIGLVHGFGAPWGITGRVREMFADEEVVVFGHSHIPCNQVVKGSLLFNPGAARGSFGILTVDDEVKGEIIRI
jgi:uncharacterized protein